MPIYPSEHAWVLETCNTAYAFSLNKQGVLVHQY